jgi:ATPase complex subunit ATP10
VRRFPLLSLTRSFASSPSLSKHPLASIQGPDAPSKDTLPPLNRPLGVRERPTTLVKSTKDRLKELMDTDVRMAQRRHLFVALALCLRCTLTAVVGRIKEASVGYFHDLNMTRKHGGKTWVAPKVLIREDVSCLSLLHPARSNARLRKPCTCPTLPARAWTRVR